MAVRAKRRESIRQRIRTEFPEFDGQFSG